MFEHYQNRKKFNEVQFFIELQVRIEIYFPFFALIFCVKVVYYRIRQINILLIRYLLRILIIRVKTSVFSIRYWNPLTNAFFQVYFQEVLSYFFKWKIFSILWWVIFLMILGYFCFEQMELFNKLKCTLAGSVFKETEN